MAQVKIQSQGLVIIILILAASFVLIAPLSPVISFNFIITSTGNYQSPYQITVTNVQYQKQQLGATLTAAKNEIILNVLSPPTGNYVLQIRVSYDQTTLAEGPFAVGLGSYQGKVVFWPRSESSGTPYAIYLTLSLNGQTLAQTTAFVSPT